MRDVQQAGRRDPLVVLTALRARLRDCAPTTWVFTGDSITQGAKHTHGRRSYVEHFQERVRWELRRTADCVVNTGVSGDQVQDLAAGFVHRVGRFSPDVVAVMLGTNDALAGRPGRAAFRRSILDLVSRIRDVGAIPLLQTPPPIDASATERAALPEYVEELRSVSDEYGVPVVDHFARWADFRCGAARRNDPVHPNGRGHLELARELFRVLGIFDPTSPTCVLTGDASD